MHEHKIEESNRSIRKVTNTAIATNIGLTVLKIIFGYFGHSIALIADGIHSLSDMTTDLAVLVGVRLGSKAPDKTHPYGHGRFETAMAAFIAAVLIFVGVGMIYYAAVDIIREKVSHPAWPVAVIAIVSVIAKEFLYQITKHVAIKTHSSAAYANAWHHRSDAFSSVAVIIGLIAIHFGFRYGDQAAAIVVGVMISIVGLQIIGSCFQEFSERAVDSKTIEQIETIIKSNPQVRNWHKLRTRTLGREIFLDVHILVDPTITITDAHKISETLENQIHEQLDRPANITVHIEPDLPELRK